VSSSSNVAAFRRSAPDAVPDRELIDRTLAGDGNAYAAIVERYQRKIFRVASSIVRDPYEADAVTQDTFVQAYTNLAKFRGEAELETWLMRIAVNRSRDALRRRRVVSFFSFRNDDEDGEPVIEPVDERPDAERQLLSSQLRLAIERAERGLSAQQLTIFRLRHYEDLSLEEIAVHLGLASGTVRAHLFRAIHKIRKELAGWRQRAATRETHEALQ
jgi:RNA polymerase sigma-70 factor (ECF subfamily)